MFLYCFRYYLYPTNIKVSITQIKNHFHAPKLPSNAPNKNNFEKTKQNKTKPWQMVAIIYNGQMTVADEHDILKSVITRCSVYIPLIKSVYKCRLWLNIEDWKTFPSCWSSSISTYTANLSLQRELVCSGYTLTDWLLYVNSMTISIARVSEKADPEKYRKMYGSIKNMF